jgi:predicted AAA+ superfamily ATPase
VIFNSDSLWIDTKAMKEFNINNGMIITYDESEEIKSAHGSIKVIPAWIWLLEKK